MDKSKRSRERRQRAHRRIRGRISGTGEKPRLAVFKSLKYIYAQVIDDDAGITLAQANSCEEELKKKLAGATKARAAARLVGEVVAERARNRGIDSVVFDRGGYVYHGKVKELAEAARSKGLKF